MMNMPVRKHFFLQMAAGFMAAVAATTAWSQEPLPDSLPARMPARAAWKITLGYADESGAGATSRFSVYFPKTISVKKSGDTIHETTIYRSGKTRERWLQGPNEAAQLPDTTTVVAVDFGDDPPADYFTFKNSDFQDLDWLGPETLRGTGTYEGRKVLIFAAPGHRTKPGETSNSSETPSLPVPFGKTRARIAALDAKTFRPVYFFDGGSARVYEYLDPPAGALIPPPEFARVLAGRRKGN